MNAALAKLKPSEARAVEALLVAESAADAARQLGKHPRTVQRMLQRKSVQEALVAARSAALQSVTGRLQGVASEAVSKLLEVMRTGSEFAALQAAQTLINSAYRAGELDLSARLDEIERLLQDRGLPTPAGGWQ